MARTRSPTAALVLAVALAALAVGPATVAGQAAANAASPCTLSASPAKCLACVKTAKAPKDAKDATLTALTCSVCSSLPAGEQQDTCTACVKTQGSVTGCSACAGAALYLPDGAKPTAQGLATAGACYSCYAKAGKDIQSTPACALCYAPLSKDPAGCASCVAGATGIPAAARAGCFGCYLKSTADAAGCNACLKGAGTAPNAQVCPMCAKEGAAKAEQGTCYSCMGAVKASLPGVRWLCHFTGTVEGNKPTPSLTAAVPAYFKCLSSASTLEAGQGCRRCMDSIEKGATAGPCFAALTA